MFDRDILILHPVGGFFRLHKCAVYLLRDINFVPLPSWPAHPRNPLDLGLDCVLHGRSIYSHFFQHLPDKAVLLRSQRGEQVRLLNLHILVFDCKILRGLQSLERFLGKFLSVHKRPSHIYGMYWKLFD